MASAVGGQREGEPLSPNSASAGKTRQCGVGRRSESSRKPGATNGKEPPTRGEDVACTRKSQARSQLSSCRVLAGVAILSDLLQCSKRRSANVSKPALATEHRRIPEYHQSLGSRSAAASSIPTVSLPPRRHGREDTSPAALTHRAALHAVLRQFTREVGGARHSHETRNGRRETLLASVAMLDVTPSVPCDPVCSCVHQEVSWTLCSRLATSVSKAGR